MVTKKFAILCLIFSTSLVLSAQDLTEANELYKEGAYADAVPLYETVVTNRPSAAVKSKLANCYRILGQLEKAAQLYADITRDDIALPTDILHYGEVLISLGKSDSAKIYVKKYNELYPDDVQAKRLLDVCDKIKGIKTWQFDSKVTGFQYNSRLNERVVAYTSNGVIFSSDRPTGSFGKGKAKSKSKGEETVLWYAVRQTDGSFIEPVRFSKKLDALNKNGDFVSFSSDMKTVYYSRPADEPNKRGKFKSQLFTASCEDGSERWRNETALPFCSTEEDYFNPSLSPDGKRLYFAAERADAFGETDIFYVDKQENGSWGKPINVGKNINTELEENNPVVGADGRLYFCSKGHIGFGGYDIFVTEQDANGDWTAPVNLGSPINSPYDDFSILFADATSGALNSSRAGKNQDAYFFNLTLRSGEAMSVADTKPVVAPKQEDKKPQQEPATKQKEVIVASVKTEVNKQIAAETGKKNNEPSKNEQPSSEEKKTTNQTVNDDDTPSVAEAQETSKKSFVDEISRLIASGRLKSSKRIPAEALYFKNMYEIELTPEAEKELKRLADFMNSNKKVTIEIGSYTEVMGDSKKLKQISQRRAEKIQEFLTAQGVKEKRLKAKGYGSLRPIKDCRSINCGETDDDINRRIELKVKNSKK